MKRIIVTVDGYSSCGKSTMARQLAKKLEYVFVDSGAMYRAITLYFLRNGIDTGNEESVRKALDSIQLSFRFNPENHNNEIWMNGENIESLIRDMSVAQHVSEVAAIKAVREFAVAQQKEMGNKKGIVMDGRDIGTAVFPEAELKIFMTADHEVRAERRYRELLPRNPLITMDEVRKNLRERDHADTTREISPLKKAEDALVLDNSMLSPDQQLEIALQWAYERINSRKD